MMTPHIKIQLEDKVFNSVSEAANFLGLNNASGLYNAIKNKQPAFKGFKLTVLNNNMSMNKPEKPKSTRNIPVYCETLNKTFKSIEEAARYAKVSGWTMGVKMTTAGKFVDLKGNVYTRLLPMNSKHTYRNTGEGLQKVFKNAKYLNGKQREVTEVYTTNKEVKPIQPTPKVENKLDLAKTVLKEKVIESIKKNDFTFAKDLLDVINELN